MKIAVFGASGMVGSRVVAEAAERGYDITAITRSGAAVDGAARNLQGDMGDAQLVTQIAADHDVLVSATGPSRTGGPHEPWLNSVQTLAENSGSTRSLFVGGAGSLLVDGQKLKDTEGFPEAYKAEAETGSQALDLIRAGEYSNWTVLSPAPEIAPGDKTGHYTVALDSPAGSSVSAEDFAVALVDEIAAPKHIDARFTVAN